MSGTDPRTPPPRRLNHDTRVLLLALLVGLPGVSVAAALLWFGDVGARAQGTIIVLLALTWIGLSFALRERVVRPIQTLANVLGAFREGDFSIRVRGAGEGGALGLAYEELNGIESILRVQRLGAVEASALLQRVMAEIDVAVFAFDEEGRLRLLNRAAERLLGRTEDRAIGMTAGELRLEEVLRGPAPRTVDLSHPGGTGPWEVRRSVARQEGQRLDLVVLSDLSRALREEEREAWKRLVRVLSHEINNSLAPIQSISGSLRQLRAKAVRPEDWEEDLAKGLEVISGRAESLGRFMSAYAKLARLPPPQPAPMDVESWVRQVARLETRLEVKIRPGPGVQIQADKDQLDQVLINLIGNAADAAMETGGTVEIGWEVTDGRLQLFVEDEGPGLPETANLFVPFYTTKPGGSGIGLVLSRQIVEAHGGALILEGREDARGARARVVLPL
ncbi:MAG: ATP-binding protein [Gemmatimonadota bacterium]